MTGVLHDIYGDYTIAFLIGIGVSGLSAVTIWLAGPGKMRAVAGQLHRSLCRHGPQRKCPVMLASIGRGSDIRYTRRSLAEACRL